MSSFTFQAVDGTQTAINPQRGDKYHDVAIKANGSSPSGTLVLTARKNGSSVFETIPNATFDLSNLTSIQFVGSVAEYKITVSSISGTDIINLTDTSWRE